MIAEIVTLTHDDTAAAEPELFDGSGARARMKDLLEQAGFQVYSERWLSGDERMIEAALIASAGLFDLVVVLDRPSPGGEKMLRKLLAQVSGSGLQLAEDLLADLKSYYRKQGLEIPKDIDKQALLPRKVSWIPPVNGIRPGFMTVLKGKHFVVLPDDLREAEQMWHPSITSLIRQGRGLAVHSLSRRFRFVGLSADPIVPAIQEARKPVKISFSRDGCIATVTLFMQGEDPAVLERELERVGNCVIGDLGGDFICEGDESLHELVGKLLIGQSRSIALAESCTGGLITSLLVEVSGISSVLERGVVTYSNEAKTTLLGVPEEVIRENGAVSRITALKMAIGIRENAGTDLGLAVTGIAGPTGGTSEKPVGTVFIGLATPGGNEVHEYHFQGDRKAIRLQGAQMALDRVRRYLVGV